MQSEPSDPTDGQPHNAHDEEASCRAAGVATPPPLPSKRCRACQWPIPATASKCKECGAFQDWRRHLSFSATTLSLLVALVSVSAYAGPLLTSALHPPSDDLHFQLVSCGYEPAVLQLAVSNLGERAGAIRDVTVQEAGAESAGWGLELTDRFAVVEPGRVQQLGFYSPLGLPDLLKTLGPNDDGGPDTWTVTITHVGFDGTDHQRQLRFQAKPAPPDRGVGEPYPIVMIEYANLYTQADGTDQQHLTTTASLPVDDLWVDLALRAPPGAFGEVGIEYALLNDLRADMFWADWFRADELVDTLPLRGTQRRWVSIPAPDGLRADERGRITVRLFDFAGTELGRIELPAD